MASRNTSRIACVDSAETGYGVSGRSFVRDDDRSNLGKLHRDLTAAMIGYAASIQVEVQDRQIDLMRYARRAALRQANTPE